MIDGHHIIEHYEEAIENTKERSAKKRREQEIRAGIAYVNKRAIKLNKPTRIATIEQNTNSAQIYHYYPIENPFYLE